VTPLDALVVINYINGKQSGPLPIPPVPPSVPPPFLDVSGNDEISPQDVLIVINFLNKTVVTGAGEGEAAGLRELSAPQFAPVWVPQAADEAAKITRSRTPDGDGFTADAHEADDAWDALTSVILP